MRRRVIIGGRLIMTVWEARRRVAGRRSRVPAVIPSARAFCFRVESVRACYFGQLSGQVGLKAAIEAAKSRPINRVAIL